MKRPLRLRNNDLTIRTRLLALLLLCGMAVLVNLAALISLARSVSTSLASIETAHQRQLLALNMYQELSNAEAALYRYQLENFSGFAAQFDFEIAAYGKDVESYRALAQTADERNWANQLAQVHTDGQSLGNQLIGLHDQQATDLRGLLAAQSQLADLLPGPPAAHQDTLADLQAMTLAVILHLTNPDQVSHDQFVQAANRLQTSLGAAGGNPAGAGPAQPPLATANQLQTLGARLIDNRDQQQLLFTRFSAEIFEASQLVIFQQIQPLEERRLAQAQQALQNDIRLAILVSLAAPMTFTLLAVVLALRLMHTLDRNILVLLRGADRVAAGRLEQAVEIGGTDELARLAGAFNRMMQDLSARERGLQARLAELEALREVSLQITSTLDVDRVLNTIAASALSLVRAASVQIFTGGQDAQPLRLAAGAGPLLAAEPSLPLIERVAKTAQLQAIHAASEGHAHASVALPMQLGGQVLGVLHIASDPSQALSSDDLRILRLLTDQAAVALGNARLYNDLAEREEHVRALLETMAKIQDEERRLVGLDLHDGLMQLIMSANMHLQALASADLSALDDRTRQKIDGSRLVIKRAIAEIRRVIAELRPSEVEELGLGEGLRRYALEVSEANNWQCETQIDLGENVLSAPAQAAIFRIAQEALSNAQKYSGTRRIRVELQFRDGDLALCVQDWGAGFDLDAFQNEAEHLGLVSMHERARMLGGTCQIASRPGEGARVAVQVPRASLLRRANEP